MMNGIGRFYGPQKRDYARALREVKAGRKETHWIWYIFPQIRGLGKSGPSYDYGIASLDEAKEYLADPVLSARLLEITEAVLAQDRSPREIFGGLDAMKVRSCMTLFSAAAERPEQKAVFDAVLEKCYGGKRCELTLNIPNGR